MNIKHRFQDYPRGWNIKMTTADTRRGCAVPEHVLLFPPHFCEGGGAGGPTVPIRIPGAEVSTGAGGQRHGESSGLDDSLWTWPTPQRARGRGQAWTPGGGVSSAPGAIARCLASSSSRGAPQMWSTSRDHSRGDITISCSRRSQRDPEKLTFSSGQHTV